MRPNRLDVEHVACKLMRQQGGALMCAWAHLGGLPPPLWASAGTRRLRADLNGLVRYAEYAPSEAAARGTCAARRGGPPARLRNSELSVKALLEHTRVFLSVGAEDAKDADNAPWGVMDLVGLGGVARQTILSLLDPGALFSLRPLGPPGGVLMHISAERLITTLQYPLAPPLPFFTDGPYPNELHSEACLRFFGRTIDASATAVVRLIATPVLTTAGAAYWGWHGLQWQSATVVPLAVGGAALGCMLALVGAAVSVFDMHVSGAGAVLVFVWLATQMILAGTWAVLRSTSAAIERFSRPARDCL